MSGHVVGYARVSSAGQNLDRQKEALGRLDRLFTDERSGRNRQERPGLTELLRHVRGGDTVRVASMDRLARSVVDLAQLVTELIERPDGGVTVEFIKERLTFAPGAVDPLAQFQLHMMGAFAQLERSISKDRQREGIDLAKKRGVYTGRARVLTDGDIARARHEISNGMNKTAAAQLLGCSRQVLYDALAGRGAYAPPVAPRPQMAGGDEVELPL